MKHLLSTISLVIILTGIVPVSIIAQNKKTVVTEFYYAVNENGDIDKSTVTQKRRLVYHKDRGLISVENIKGVRPKWAKEEAETYYKLPNIKCQNDDCVHDTNNRIVEYKERVNDNTVIKHLYLYNEWGDLIEDKSITMKEGNTSVQESVLTYEYFYLEDFKYAEKDGKKFISGTKPNYCAMWVLRTIKKDGEVVQFTERKINNPL